MRYYSAPRRALRGVRQLLYPRRCPFCNAVLGSIRTCPDCAEEVDRLRRKPFLRAVLRVQSLRLCTGNRFSFSAGGYL